MNLLSSDIVEFEISFRPNSKPVATSDTLIGEDYFTCKLTRDSDDNRFWTADIAEGYYQCKGTQGANTDFGSNDFCDGITYSSQF